MLILECDIRVMPYWPFMREKFFRAGTMTQPCFYYQAYLAGLSDYAYPHRGDPIGLPMTYMTDDFIVCLKTVEWQRVRYCVVGGF